MTKKETAEQKLLKIIEAQGGAASAAPASSPASPEANVAQQVADSVKSSGLPSLPPFIQSLGNIFKLGASSKNLAVHFGMREVNYLLLLAVMMVGTVLALNVFSGMRLLKKRVSFSAARGGVNALGNFIPPVIEISQYLDNFRRRNIFKPFEKLEVKESALTPEASTGLSAKTKDLKLVGVSWLDSAESASVMIEETTSGNTYFLTTGEKIRDVTIKTIYADSVILSYQGEEIALHL